MDDETLHIELLGDFRLAFSEKQISSVNTPRMQSLLAYLILNRRAPQSRQYISFLFWPDTSEKQARTNLRQLLHHLKAALSVHENFLTIDHMTLQWRADCPCIIDVTEFENSISNARRMYNKTNSDNIRPLLETAVSWYKGILLPSCYDEWITKERERLHEEFNWALELLIKLSEENEDYISAIRYAHRLLKQDELRESVYCTLMRLHALKNDRAGALRIFHQCTTTLSQELSAKPGAEIQMLYKQILNDRAIEASTIIQPLTLIDESPLVGRNKEWEKLLQSWQSAMAGNPHLFILEGEPGIGKSRLCQDMLMWVKAQGVVTAKARSYAAAGRISYGPVKSWLKTEAINNRFSNMEEVWLTELAHLLPELLIKYPNLPPPGPLLENWQRQRFFEAMAKTFLGEGEPVMLLLDDLQWCDNETLVWLLYLLRYSSEAKLLIVCSLRDSELPDDHPLLSFLSTLRIENQVKELKLEPLNELETGLLATQITGHKLQEELVKKLYKETEGNPLFIVESLREGILERLLTASKNLTIFPNLNFTGKLPRKVFEIFNARLNQLSSSARELIELASAIGREFSYKVLAVASQYQEEKLVLALDELWHRRIIREQGADSYDFSHDKLREVAYSNMSVAKRHRMHILITRALKELQNTFSEDISGTLAFHYDQAGLPQQAIPYYQQAAARAIRIYANQEAVVFLNQALNLLNLLPKEKKRDELELELQTALGLSFVPLKGYGAAEIHNICARVQFLSQQLEIIPSAPVLRTMAIGKLASGETLEALKIGKQLLTLAGKENDAVIEVEGHYVVGVINFWLGNFVSAKKHLELALAAYQPDQQVIHTLQFAQNPQVICLTRLSLTLWFLGYQSQALQKCEEAIIFAYKASHPFSLAYSLHFASWLADISGHTKIAYQRIDDMLALSEEQDFSYWSLIGNIQKGWIIAKEGNINGGIEKIKQSTKRYLDTGMKLGLPYFCTLLAQAYEKNKEYEKAIEALDKGILSANQNKYNFYDAELLRYKGILLWEGGAGKDEAENCLIKALKISQKQQAKTFELKIMKDLYQLWQAEGNKKEAKVQLQDVYNWFTEGHEFQDLIAAKSLIQSN